MIQASSPFPMSSNPDTANPDIANPDIANPANNSEMPPARSIPLPNQVAMLQTILKLQDPGLLDPPMVDPPPSVTALSTMQRLVEIINQLRATAPSTPEFATTSEPATSVLPPAAIAPYVSEEAYEVLDVLQQEQSESSGGNGQGQQREPGDWGVASQLVTVDHLVPHLLWCVARSSYRVMQLLEGVSVRQCQPGKSWTSGMLRLVTLLEIIPSQLPALSEADSASQANRQPWCFDLATGDRPTALLDGQVWLQADETVLPLRQRSVTSEHLTAKDKGQVGDQIQALQRQIQASTPAIQCLFEGLQLELLQPGQDWQMGEMRLKLGFEFVPQPAPTTAQLMGQQPDLVEAEWVEEAIAVPTSSLADGLEPGDPPLTQVCIVERPRLLNPATLIRLTDAGILERLTQANLQPYLTRAIARLKQDWNAAPPDNQLLTIVQQACALSDQYSVLVESGLNPLLPELLMDELIPKLLWQITCSSYEGMQLLGGIPARVLQPNQDWQQGTLRLLAALQIATDATDWMLDLATGEGVSSDTIRLSELAVCQQSDLPVGQSLWDKTSVWRQPVQVHTLMHNLRQQIHLNMPALDLLLQGTAIEWLESEQDWQAATLRLHIALAFTPAC